MIIRYNISVEASYILYIEEEIGMKVEKRDGRLQKYDLSKIIFTIERASDDAEEPMNESDAEIAARAIDRAIKGLGKDVVSVQEIRDTVIKELLSLGFKEIAKYYDIGNKS
jgi:transcriptional repressor NrdR